MVTHFAPWFALALSSLVACSGGHAQTDAGPVDTAPDPRIDSPAPSPLVVRGVVREHGQGSGGLAAHVQVAARRLGDDSLITMAVSAADGSFSMTLAPADSQLYLDATGSGHVETLYNFENQSDAPAATIELFTPAAYAALFAAAGVTETVGTGVLEVQAYQVDLSTPADAVPSLAPPSGTAAFDGSNGAIDPTATSTRADGDTFFLNASTGTVLWHTPNGDALSGEVRVVPGKVSEVAVYEPFGGDV